MLVSIKKAAEKLGVTTTTLRNWDKKGKLIALRTPGNARRYDINELNKFIQEMRDYDNE